ncbi:asialoglycoprotein receptor 2-like isoform X1 [Gigantopelta aegis]|uniref:asialoglycoprotein receptor 2-like isoform X1 n=1 Tax=Gigantopelta aegis TaxID=1735272 RepID=UPI001B88B998|nr:asialoglycoprotein receptor 2-like isoform X1 [Gigantopelta aegis]
MDFSCVSVVMLAGCLIDPALMFAFDKEIVDMTDQFDSFDSMFGKEKDEETYPRLQQAIDELRDRVENLTAVAATLRAECSKVMSSLQSLSVAAERSESQYPDTSGLATTVEHADSGLHGMITSLEDRTNELSQTASADNTVNTGRVQEKSSETEQRINTLQTTLSDRAKAVTDLSSTDRTGTSCPTGWASYGAHCYGFSDQKQTWTKSLALCSSTGGYLLELNSKPEWDFIAYTFMPRHGTQSIYTSATDLLLEGHWRWARSGDLIQFGDDTYMKWVAGQPDNWYGKEHYGELRARDWMSHYYRLNDLFYTSEYKPVCEKQM